MHILLTDLLTCPRCGPEFGLILLGERIRDRRVLEGVLGCPNCREEYPVRNGFGDLRAPPRSPLPEPGEGPAPAEGEEGEGEEAATRLAALLGVREGPGYLVLVGPVVRYAPRLAAMLDEIEVVPVGTGPRAWDEAPGMSRIAADSGLPFYSRRIRGVVLDGEGPAQAFLDEAVRVVGPGSRVAVLDAPSGTRRRLEEGGLDPVLDDRDGAGVVVAGR